MTKSPHPKRGLRISILLSLLLLQGCVSVSSAEPFTTEISSPSGIWRTRNYQNAVAEPLRIEVSTIIIRSALDHVVYLSPEYPTLEMYKELEARIKALEDEEYLRKGKEDVEEMKRLREK